MPVAAHAPVHHQLLKQAAAHSQPGGGLDLSSAPLRAQLAALQGQWAVAEALLLAAGMVDSAIDMYQVGGCG